MTRLVIADRTRLYQDVVESNSPKKILFDLQLDVVKDLTSFFHQDIVQVGPLDITFSLPVATCSFLYVITSQIVQVKLNGEIADNVQVSPSVAGTKDGFLLKRGSFTALQITSSVTETIDLSVLVGA